MRAAPALQVIVEGRGFSRWLVAALGAASAAAAVWWLGSRLGSAVGTTPIALCVATPLAAWAGWRVSRPPTRELRFDGQAWWLSTSAPGGQILTGELAVVIDLSAWMLLRFDAPASHEQVRCRRWLAVDRRRLDTQWHALRCAVYSPRPGAPPGARDAPDPSSRE